MSDYTTSTVDGAAAFERMRDKHYDEEAAAEFDDDEPDDDEPDDCGCSDPCCPCDGAKRGSP